MRGIGMIGLDLARRSGRILRIDQLLGGEIDGAILRELRFARLKHALDRHIDQIARKQTLQSIAAHHERTVCARLLRDKIGLERVCRFERRFRGRRKLGLELRVLNARECGGHVILEKADGTAEILERHIDEHGRHVRKVLLRVGDRLRELVLARDHAGHAGRKRREVALDQRIDR